MKELNQVIFRKFVCEEIFKIRQDYLGAQNTCYLSYLRQQKCHLKPTSFSQSTLFWCLLKVDHVTNYWKRPIAISYFNFKEEKDWGEWEVLSRQGSSNSLTSSMTSFSFPRP